MTELTRYQMYINGEWVDAENGATFTSVNPATGQTWAEVPEASEADINRAVEAAHHAFSEGAWATMTPTARGKMLRRLAEVLAEHSEPLGRCETVDTGKLFKETRWQANYMSDFFQYYAGLADKVTGETLPIDKPDMMTMTVREPLGVVAAVVPWNSQLFLVAVKIGPALAAGNTVVLKASEHASAPMLEFAKVFEEAGFPPGVFNVVTGHGEPCGRALTSHPLVDRVSFTGGPETARHVIRNSAENFAEVSLELGGKSPVMVFEDADLESAVNGVLLSIFSASGQSCVAGSRLLLQESIREEVLSRVVEKAAQIRIGDPLDDNSQMGPLATEAQLSNIQSTLADATANGADLRYGGNTPPGLETGWYIEPTIVDCPIRISVSSEMNCSARLSARSGLKMRPKLLCSPTIRISDWRAASSPEMLVARFVSARRFAPVSSGSTPIGWCRPSRLLGATRTAATAASPAWRRSMTTRVPRRYG